MATYHLYRWSVCYDKPDNSYQAPEQIRRCICGFRDQDNKRIVSSAIVSVEGREVKTMYSTYILEDIDPDYLQWMHDNGFTYDPENPIPKKK